MYKYLAAVSAIFLSMAVSAELAVKNSDKIGFLGDSITYYGNSYSGGYVNLVISGLEANGIKAQKIPAGISGNKSPQMLARLQKDILDKKPDIMILSCGVNDVWHGTRGVELTEYRKLMAEIVDKAQAAGVKVCILTPTMITENPEHQYNKKLAEYADAVRTLAKEKNCMLADLNADMQKIIADFKKANPGFQGTLLTNDGVHMNALGDVMMATGILRAFGLNDSQLKKARQAWQGKTAYAGKLLLSAETIEKLAIQAAKHNMTIVQYVESIAAKYAEK